MDPPEHQVPDPLAEPLAETVGRQAAEIERLRSELARLQLLAELRQRLEVAGVTGVIGAPTTFRRLTEMIVVTAADVINAEAGALFLLDEERDELVFEVAIGPRAQNLGDVRLPLGHGLAGLVAATGQPMAIADTAEDVRDAEDIAAAVGYAPKSLLCVPLMFEDELIGVLELLDKANGEPFSATDMETLALFAEQAAVAVSQDRLLDQLSLVIRKALSSLTDAPSTSEAALEQTAARLADDIVGDAGYRRALALARLVMEISRRGVREHEACEAMLTGFAAYLRSQPGLDGSARPWQ